MINNIKYPFLEIDTGALNVTFLVVLDQWKGLIACGDAASTDATTGFERYIMEFELDPNTKKIKSSKYLVTVYDDEISSIGWLKKRNLIYY